MNDIAPPSVGSIAPELAIRDTTGAVRSIGELSAGGRLVLVFFRGHW